MFPDQSRSAVVAVPSQSSPQRRPQRLPVAADTPSSPYAPGALRKASDEEHVRLRAFCSEHPEYERALGYEGLLQVAATYRDERDQQMGVELNAAGVPADWGREARDLDSNDIVMAEEQ